MSAYYIFDITEVKDPEKMEEYRKRAGRTMEQYGGRYVVRGGEFEALEGDWQPVRLVLVEFPNLERARAWYKSEEYQELLALRTAAANSLCVLVEGV